MSQPLLTAQEAHTRVEKRKSQELKVTLDADLAAVLAAIDQQSATSDNCHYTLPNGKTYSELRASLQSLGYVLDFTKGYDCGCQTMYGCTHGDNEGTYYERWTVSW